MQLTMPLHVLYKLPMTNHVKTQKTQLKVTDVHQTPWLQVHDRMVLVYHLVNIHT